MKKILLVTLLLASLNTLAEVSNIRFNNIDIKVFSESKVQVFQDDVHMFGIDCNNGILCSIFASHTSNPEYKMFDGIVQPNSKVLRLSAKNVQAIVDKKDELVFIMSSGNVSGSYASVREFVIDTDTGAFYHIVKEYDYLRYGHPEDYPLLRR